MYARNAANSTILPKFEAAPSAMNPPARDCRMTTHSTPQYQREWQKKNIERLRVLEKERGRKDRAKFPERHRGNCHGCRIPAKPCFVCGSFENIERHHPDYSRPLEVTFLCRQHHKRLHANTRRIESIIIERT